MKSDGAGANVHRDFEFIRLTADGQLDPTFGNGGKTTVDVGGYAFPRQTAIQQDGKIVASGYVDTVASDPVEPFTLGVVIRLNANGTLDTTFNGTGIVRADLLGQNTEFYDIAMQGSSVLTTGYGRSPADARGIT
ncbi:MAG: hypothetical protein ACRDRT_14545 [Pseudonocardiaceae bacterium]